MKSGALILTMMTFCWLTASAQKVYSTNSSYQADTGKDFKSGQSNKTAAYQKAYERNSKAVRTEFDFEPEEPNLIKIIYTPMGNRR